MTPWSHSAEVKVCLYKKQQLSRILWLQPVLGISACARVTSCSQVI